MPITLVNRSKAEITIYIGEDKEALVFEAGERKDEIDGSKCLGIKDHIYVKSCDIEVFGNPEDDVKTPDKETAAQKKAREAKEKAEADVAKNEQKNQTAK